MRITPKRLLATALWCASTTCAVPPCDNTQSPCYTNVSDILNGTRTLLPSDDIFFSSVSADRGVQTISNTVLTTSQ